MRNKFFLLLYKTNKIKMYPKIRAYFNYVKILGVSFTLKYIFTIEIMRQTLYERVK